MKSVNFEFLRPGNDVLANLAGLAEAVLHIDAGSCLTRLRSFAEELTKAIYKEELLPRMPQSSFFDLVKNPVFEDCVSRSLIHQINFLRIQGNETAHGGEGDLRNAEMALRTAHQLAIYMAVKYYGLKKDDIPPLADVQDPTIELARLQKSVSSYEKELQKQQSELESVMEQLERERTRKLENIDPPAKPDQQKRQQQSQQVADSLSWNEAKTRKQLIDAMLTQAGWDVTDTDKVSEEFEVSFPNNPSGKGYVDYVLWGDNGHPLAVVEAKKSGNTNLQAGREQARLYADAMEGMGFQRPVIFYTNGYETFIWDDHQYNTYRPVYGFYSKDSLEYLIYQRHYRAAELEKFNPDLNIADRPYQIEAIKTVAAHFQTQRRKALIIQATGTGKTRVAIALAELLLRTGWAKRALFLCDRKELRVQADDAFKQNLPSEPRCVIGETNAVDQSARIYIATYPGMMNRFAQLDVGFFDLIIADESHRSIYNKYRDLFDYFDALQVGLTATPVKFISRNTFDMFGCDTTDPTFEFGLDAAINNEPPYLVPYVVKDLTTDFLRNGMHHSDMTDEQKRQLEQDLGEEEAQKRRRRGVKSARYADHHRQQRHRHQRHRIEKHLALGFADAGDHRQHRHAGGLVIAFPKQRQRPRMGRRPQEDDGEQDHRAQADVAGGGGPADHRRQCPRGAADDDVLRRAPFQPYGIDKDVIEDRQRQQRRRDGIDQHRHRGHRTGSERDAEDQRFLRLQPPGREGPVHGPPHVQVDVAVVPHVDGARRAGAERDAEDGEKAGQGA